MTRKIAVISEHASPLAALGGVDSGGQNVYVAHVAENLARLGYEVDVFTRRDDKSLPEIYRWIDGVRIIHVPAGPAEFVRKEELLGHMQEFSRYMINFFQRLTNPYDLVHANFWMSGLVAANIKAVLGIPYVITFHALDRVRREFQGADDEFPEQRFEIEQRIAREADGIIAECPQDKEDLIHYYQADASKIREIPCGFDPLELWPVDKKLARAQIGIDPHEWVALQLGRMVPRKGVDTAICSFARAVRNQDLPARLVIVGGGSREPDPIVTPEIGRLQKIAEEEGVLDRVTFVGSRGRQELKYYYSAADVFISTPWYEPFGITPIEAMACGTPVIGARVGGIKYTVVDGETGYLVPPKDPQAVADGLIYLYQNPEQQKKMSRRALERVNQMFTWQKVGEMIAAFYEDVLSEREPLAGACPSACAVSGITDELATVRQGFASALDTLQQCQEILSNSIIDASKMLVDCLQHGGKLMVCGNGGSAADAQHFTAELVGRFGSDQRKGLACVSLTADSAFLTAWSNDVGYEKIFARQVEAYGQPGDILVGISTSGRSKNVIEAFEMAHEMNIKCLALLGTNGGDLLSLADTAVLVPSWNTQRIQEVHILVLHLLCELIEKQIHQGPTETVLSIEQTSLAKSSGQAMNYSRLFSVDNHRDHK
jgi:D-inositol-3-phosphate glycosyltransferase